MTVSPSEITPLRWAAYCSHSSIAASENALDKCRQAPAHLPQIKAEPELALFDAGRAVRSKRSNLSKLVAMAEADEIDLLVVPSVSRINPSPILLSRIINAIKSCGAGLYSIDEGWFVYPKALQVGFPSSAQPMAGYALSIYLNLASAFNH